MINSSLHIEMCFVMVGSAKPCPLWVYLTPMKVNYSWLFSPGPRPLSVVVLPVKWLQQIFVSLTEVTPLIQIVTLALLPALCPHYALGIQSPAGPRLCQFSAVSGLWWSLRIGFEAI